MNNTERTIDGLLLLQIARFSLYRRIRGFISCLHRRMLTLFMLMLTRTSRLTQSLTLTLPLSLTFKVDIEIDVDLKGDVNVDT